MFNQLKNQIQLHETNLNLHKSLLTRHSQDVGAKTQAFLSSSTTLATVFAATFIMGFSKRAKPAKQAANLAERLSTVFTLYRLWQKFSHSKTISS